MLLMGNCGVFRPGVRHQEPGEGDNSWRASHPEGKWPGIRAGGYPMLSGKDPLRILRPVWKDFRRLFPAAWERPSRQ